MLAREAKRLGILIGRLHAADISPMLNIGSSTKEFRSRTQPWIEGEIFNPLEMMGVRVVHSDIKLADGVDVVGDISNQEFQEKLQSMRFQSVLCANLLEHVHDKNNICRAIESVVESGGYIVVTVPNKYPYHPDPIDTKYRPTPDQLAELFPKCSVVHGEIINCGTYLGRLNTDKVALIKVIVRLCMPFYKPESWWRQVCLASWSFRNFMVTCLVLQKL